MVVFQAAFGLLVFTLTRHYYIQEADQISAPPSRQAAAEWPDLSEKDDLENSISSFSGLSAGDDPKSLSHQADEYFASRQYDQAAIFYQRLVLAEPGNADAYNNLGLTLHYLGRSVEALNVLNEGVTINPSYQRIWLTLGYVNSQLGNREQARAALSSAVKLDANSEVGQSAAQMLDAL